MAHIREHSYKLKYFCVVLTSSLSCYHLVTPWVCLVTRLRDPEPQAGGPVQHVLMSLLQNNIRKLLNCFTQQPLQYRALWQNGITYARWAGRQCRALGLWCWESLLWWCFSAKSPSAAAGSPAACSAESPRWTWRWSPAGAPPHVTAAAADGSVSWFHRRRSLSGVLKARALFVTQHWQTNTHFTRCQTDRPIVNMSLPVRTFEIKKNNWRPDYIIS